ncbi:MAG: hypothetical protein ACTSUE_26690 [Promethearchaeota archaeon]
MDDFLKNNLREISRLNQRGGRMLSIVDLIERKTLTLELAARLAAGILEGKSFLCCALPGGVGKTTLMGAILGLIPRGEKIITVESEAMIPVLKEGSGSDERQTLVVHEIGSGSWFGYLWGPAVLEFMELASDTRIRIISNIHADYYKEIVEQIEGFGGDIGDLRRFDIILFISIVEGTIAGYPRRVVNQVLEYKSGTAGSHVETFVYTGKSFIQRDEPDLNPKEGLTRKLELFFKECIKDGKKRIEDVSIALQELYLNVDA